MAWLGRYDDDDNIVGEARQDNKDFSEGSVPVDELQKNKNNVAIDFVQLGQLLVSARKKANLTREQIIARLKIKEEILEAIEDGNVNDLKLPNIYLRSFLREYCELLGAKNIWREYDHLTIHMANIARNDICSNSKFQKEHGMYTVTTTGKKSRVVLVVFLIVVTLLAIYFIYQMQSDIASQFISPAEIVMGLNPLDKVESSDGKENSQENMPKTDLESDGVVSVNNDDSSTVTNANDSQSSDNIHQTEVSAVVTEKKLPVDSASFGWLDKNNQTEGNGAQVSNGQTNGSVVEQKPNMLAKDKRMITVKAVNILWIRVATANRRIFQGLMKKGEVRNFEVESVPVTIRYGKGNKALVTWNGVETLVSNEPKPITVKYTLEAR